MDWQYQTTMQCKDLFESTIDARYSYVKNGFESDVWSVRCSVAHDWISLKTILHLFGHLMRPWVMSLDAFYDLTHTLLIITNARIHIHMTTSSLRCICKLSVEQVYGDSDCNFHFFLLSWSTWKGIVWNLITHKLGKTTFSKSVWSFLQFIWAILLRILFCTEEDLSKREVWQAVDILGIEAILFLLSIN